MSYRGPSHMDNIPQIDRGDFSTPILFMIFNRPDTTERVFERIRQIRPKVLYIASDGPRLGLLHESECVKKSREIATSVDWPCRVSTLFRPSNLGCKKAVSSALSWFFSNEESGIVLEDDCLPSLSFFFYCAELLERYKDQDIGMISGYTIDDTDTDHSYRFSRITNIWGWASWRRSWQLYLPDLTPDVVHQSKVYDKFLHHSELVRDTFLQYATPEIDTWDIQWIFSVINNFRYSILPTKSLIQNIGFDARATHTKREVSRFSAVRASELAFPLTHPNNVVDSRVESLDAQYLSMHHGL